MQIRWIGRLLAGLTLLTLGSASASATCFSNSFASTNAGVAGPDGPAAYDRDRVSRPEPGTCVMLGSALLGVGLLIRRHRA